GGVVGPVGIHGGQRGRPEDAGGSLDLPEKLVGGGELAVIKVLDLNKMPAALALRMLVGVNSPDGRQAIPHLHGLANFWGPCLGQHDTPRPRTLNLSSSRTTSLVFLGGSYPLDGSGVHGLPVHPVLSVGWHHRALAPRVVYGQFALYIIANV